MNRLLAIQAETVIVADDHPLFRTAIKEALEAEQGETCFLEASSFERQWNFCKPPKKLICDPSQTVIVTVVASLMIAMISVNDWRQ